MKMESQVNAMYGALNRYWNLVQTARCVLEFKRVTNGKIFIDLEFGQS